MWLMTPYGFFSVVCALTKQGNPDTNYFVIRSRMKEHLQELKRAFSPLKGCRVLEHTGTDYPYRLKVRRKTWVPIVTKLMEDVDYCNFKNEVANVWSYSSSYTQALHRVWSIMRNLEHYEEH